MSKLHKIISWCPVFLPPQKINLSKLAKDSLKIEIEPCTILHEN